MKTRIVSALVGLVVLGAILFFYNTIVVNIAISILILIAVDELLSATGIKKNLGLSLVAFFLGGILPFYSLLNLSAYLGLLVYIAVFVMFIILLAEHESTTIEHLTFSLMMTLMVAISMTLFIVMRDSYGVAVGLFGAGLTFMSAWMSDTGAYFVGVFFGKHKLAPVISPKKTKEGFAGGTVIGSASILLWAYFFESVLCGYFGWSVSINYTLLLIVAPLLSITSVVGDLSASAIKRQYGIKDFGKIMPGHGGVLDRFDSVLLISPLSYFIVTLLGVITAN